MKKCDLHCHSNFSDGTLTPTELVKLAEKQGLSALALTDHNTSNGLTEFMEAGKNSDVVTVPGCEFTTEWRGIELHIVGLFFKRKYWNEIEDFMEIPKLAKHNSNLLLIENLNKAGYEVTAEEASALSDGEFNRTHIARVLVSKGYLNNISEGFEGILKDGNGFYKPAKRISSMAAINFIKTNEATAILAHPLLNLTSNDLLEFLPEAKEAGLDAIETIYTEFDEEMTHVAKELAEEFDLKQSGGSDFHGTTKPGIYLGAGRNNITVPFEFYEDMLSCAKDYKES